MGVLTFPPGVPVWIDLATTSGTTPSSIFYCRLFGWRVLTSQPPTADAYGYWIFRQGDKDVGGIGPDQLPTWTMYIGVTDADEKARAIVNNGGTVLMWPLAVYDAGRLALFHDPLGARFAIWEPGEHTGFDLMHEPNSYTWSDLVCPDVEAATGFYNKVFGWEAKSSNLYAPDVDEPIAGLVEGGSPAHWMIHFAVADADDTAARAATSGGLVEVAPTDRPDGGRMAVLRDPEGARFTVVDRASTTTRS